MRLIFIIICCFFCEISIAQQVFNRLEADFSIKEKFKDGSQKLTMGKVYFNLKNKQLIYKITFPENQLIVMNDSITYQFVNNQLISKKNTKNLIDFSVFNLALQGDLPFFGIKKTPFILDKIENQEGMTISTWLPPKRLETSQGKIIISQKQQQLFGMISYSPQNQIIGKQFFRKYEQFQGLSFPTEIINYTYFEQQENIKITTYKNVKINNYTDNTYYVYPLPK